jgi:predicted nucleic acid-binding protein
MTELYDTCVFIDYWNGDSAASTLINKAVNSPKTVSYSPISVVELWQSAKLERQEEIEFAALTQHFLQDAGLNTNVAKRAGQSLMSYHKHQRMQLTSDAIIAATAEERGDKIRTRNIKDIKKFYSNVEIY